MKLSRNLVSENLGRYPRKINDLKPEGENMTTANAEVSKDLETYIPEAQRREINTDLVNAQMNAKELVGKDQESMDKANNVLTWISARQKGIENFRLAIVKPL